MVRDLASCNILGWMIREWCLITLLRNCLGASGGVLDQVGIRDSARVAYIQSSPRIP